MAQRLLISGVMKTVITIVLALALHSPSAFAANAADWKLDGFTEDSLFNLSLYPQTGDPIIGDYQNWVVEVKDGNLQGIENAEIALGGGMSAHKHGLPSQPKVTKYLGEGKYLIEGMLFNMAGKWTLLVSVRKGRFLDTAEFEMNLKF